MSLYQSIRELRRGNRRRHPSPAKQGRRLVVESLEQRMLLASQTGTSPHAGGLGAAKSSDVVGLMSSPKPAIVSALPLIGGSGGAGAGKASAVVGLFPGCPGCW
jgi:hypothetical protein